MNTRTIERLDAFTRAVEKLAAATITIIGMQTASEIIGDCHLLRQALRDEDAKEIGTANEQELP